MKIVGILPESADRMLRRFLPEDWEVVIVPGEEKVTNGHLEGAELIAATAYTPVSRATIEQLNGIKLIQQISAGIDSIDLAAARERNIPVANVPTGNTIAVAEYVVSTAIMLLHRLREAEQLGRDGARVDRPILRMGAADLYEKTVGLVGVGNIGREVARRLAPFGVKMIYTKRSRLSSEEEQSLAIEHTTLDELLAQSDVISLQIPYTPDTRHLIAKDQLAKLKSSAVFINVARGGIVDETALAAALNNDQLAAAAVDVYEVEPIQPDNPLHNAKNAFLTPHIAGVTNDSIRRMFRLACENLVRASRNEPIEYRVW